MFFSVKLRKWIKNSGLFFSTTCFDEFEIFLILSEMRGPHKCHLYTIVGREDKDIYNIQCANLSAVFKETIFSIAEDIELISGLLPAQACFIGLKYSKLLKSNEKLKYQATGNELFHVLQRYGKYKICYIDPQ